MPESTVRIGLVLPDVMGTYGDGGNASCCGSACGCADTTPRSSRSAGGPGSGIAGPVHARRCRGLGAASRDPAPAALSGPATRRRTRCARAGDLRGHPGTRPLVRDVGGRARRRCRNAGRDHVAAADPRDRRDRDLPPPSTVSPSRSPDSRTTGRNHSRFVGARSGPCHPRCRQRGGG